MSLEIRLEPAPAADRLAARWTALEARAEASFFQGWCWVGRWLEASGVAPLLLEATSAGRTIALGLLVPRRARRRGVLMIRQLCLTETGDPAIDRLTIEHNGFLVDRAAPPGLIGALLGWLGRRGGWDELVLGGVPAAYAEAARAAGFAVELDRIGPSFAVELARYAEPGSWLASRSANMRAQIRQSVHYAERDGPVALEPAGSPAEAGAWLEDLGALHQRRWQDRPGGGAFATPFTVAFHRGLVRAGFASGEVELLRLSAGARRLGYLYNLVAAGTVANYQGGFDYLPDNRHRPGLVAHALAIERARAAGHRRYELLEGDAAYKRRLAEPGETLVWCRVQAPRLRLALERLARGLVRRLRRPRSGRLPQAQVPSGQ